MLIDKSQSNVSRDRLQVSIDLLLLTPETHRHLECLILIIINVEIRSIIPHRGVNDSVSPLEQPSLQLLLGRATVVERRSKRPHRRTPRLFAAIWLECVLFPIPVELFLVLICVLSV
jgi:hypothetical protein